jgi:16S rRNA (guanine527-N7)-methyltransferase
VAARDFKTRLARRASRAGIQLPDTLSEQLAAYYELLSRWNRKINLTSLEDPDQAIDRLLLEPVVAARYVADGVQSLMDVGSGGGSPALPLALAIGNVQLVMVEVKARKSAFLREAIRTLGLLSSAEVENARFEEVLAKPGLLEHFDVLSIRAVRIESRVLNTVQAFVRPGGTVFLFRGPSGPERPDLLPPMEWHSTVPLVDSLQSRLTIATKTSRPGYVPRGTLAPARSI